jgi:magnesium transporter
MKQLLIFETGSKPVASSIEDVKNCLETKKTFWLDISAPEKADFAFLKEVLKIPGPQMEEIRTGQSLPKLKRAAGLTFLSWYSIDPGVTSPPERFECVICDRFLLTVHHQKMELMDKVLSLMAGDPDLAAEGPERVLYELMDAAVDDYFLIVDGFSDEVDELEDVMFNEPTSKDVKRLFTLKRKMLELRKIAAPEREVVNSVLRREQSFVSAENIGYYEDLYDHLVRIIDLIDTLHDVASGAMQIYQATISNNLNSIMKTLTIIATIAMPLSVIAGIYGMNFKYMPELYWHYGYFYILGLMILITGGMLYWFWRRKWL